MESPKTLLDAIQFFSDAENCRKFMIAVRWEDGIVRCPTCNSDKVAYLENARVYYCKAKHSKQKFSLKIGTIFEDSPISLEKWLPAYWLLVNCKNGISSYELGRAVGVTQKSAWFMLHRIRYSMQNSSTELMGLGIKGAVEVDETFVAGKPANMHFERRMRHLHNEKTPIVMGMLARNTREVRAKVIPNVKRETLQTEILNNVGFGTHVYTDRATGYDNLDRTRFVHKTVNHMTEYVRGNVHTNGIENFWSLLKRTLKGTYVAVEPFHLDAYVAEQVFRFNNSSKKMDDSKRFQKAVLNVTGKRLTYAELTGKSAEIPF